MNRDFSICDCELSVTLTNCGSKLVGLSRISKGWCVDIGLLEELTEAAIEWADSHERHLTRDDTYILGIQIDRFFQELGTVYVLQIILTEDQIEDARLPF